MQRRQLPLMHKRSSQQTADKGRQKNDFQCEVSCALAPVWYTSQEDSCRVVLCIFLRPPLPTCVMRRRDATTFKIAICRLCFIKLEPVVMPCKLHRTLAEAKKRERKAGKAYLADYMFWITVNPVSPFMVSTGCSSVYCVVFISSQTNSFTSLLNIEDIDELLEI